MPSDDSPFSIHPLSADRLPEWLRFFDHDAFADNPRWQSCYCHFLHADPAEKPWEQRTGEENRRAVIPLIERRELHGFLAYAGDKVIGWCHAAPSAHIPALHDEPGAMDGDVGSVVCFVVAKPWRRRGVAHALLDAACADLKAQGMGIVQAYPQREPKSEGAMHMGPLQLYLDRGFQVWRDVPGDSSVTVRKAL